MASIKETNGDVIRGASGSYNASAYPEEPSFQGVTMTAAQLRSRGWDTSWIGPECLLDGEARPTVPMIHTVRDREKAREKR